MSKTILLSPHELAVRGFTPEQFLAIEPVRQHVIAANICQARGDNETASFLLSHSPDPQFVIETTQQHHQ